MPTILLKKSDTPGSVPGTANLTNLAGGVEVAVNTADKRVYSMTSASAVIELGTNPSSLTLSGGTANGVLYLNGSKVATSGSALTFDGTNLTTGSSNGISVGKAFTSGAGNLQVGGSASASLFTQEGVDVVRMGVRASGRTGIAFDSSNATYTNRMWYIDNVGANGTLTFGRQGLDVITLDNTGNVGIGTASPQDKLSALSTQGVNTFANPVMTYGANFSWPAGFANIYDASYVDQFILLNARMTGGTRAAPTFTGAANGGISLKVDGLAGGLAIQTIPSGSGASATTCMYLNTSGNVGIGTASPSYKLHVVGGAAIANRTTSDTPGNISLGVLSTSSVAQFGWRTDSSNNLHFDIYNGASWSAALTTSLAGNLGLGVTPSAWNSGYKATQIKNISTFTASLDANFGSNVFVNSAGNYAYIANGVASIYTQNAGTHVWQYAPSGTANNQITGANAFVQAMTLDASGNLLVGGTSQSGTANREAVFSANKFGLAIIDTTAQTTGVGGALNLGGNYRSAGDAQAFVRIEAAKENATDGNYAYAMAFSTTPNGGTFSERGRFSAGGYFKASNAGTYQGATGAYHELRTDAADYSTIVGNTNASPYGAYILFGSADPNNSTNLFLLCNGWNGSTLVTRTTIRSNGGLANYQSNNVDLSDSRTKNSITPAASMWDKIGALEIVTYKYNDQTHDDVNVGVIAQQVESVEPVWVDADGFGETPEGEEPLKTVYTKDITFAAIKALQEAMARIEQLEAKVSALEAK